MSEYTTVTEQEVDLVEDLLEEQRPPAMELAEAETAAPVQEAGPTATADPTTQAAGMIVNGTAVDRAVPAEEKEEEDALPVKPVQAGLRPGLRAGLSR